MAEKETTLALQLTRPSQTTPPTLTLITLPIPTPKEGQVLVRIHASAIQPSDILNTQGAFPYTTFPRVPGRDFAGTIFSSPSDPSLINQEIYGTSGNTLSFTSDGAHAEYILVPSTAVASKPTNLSFAQAATIGVPFTTAALAVKKGEVKSGERVLVLGANGAVGSAAVQIAGAKGAKVLKGVRGPKGDVDTGADPELSALKEPVDVVIDTVGQPSLTAAAARKLGRAGRLVFIAAPRSGETVLGIEMVDFYRLEKRVEGINTLLYGIESFAEELRSMSGLFEEGKLVVGEGWTEVPLKEGVDAYNRAGKKGGIDKFISTEDRPNIIK
ncbi:GroES-like protein [Mollisia scopiformis]|uniref:GroES-like protein n=1 Tax=Mollisia scopiformis TaxID=149040 RepID=A0A194X0H8_MOLSC|nr:GroES-like protein [Mollisia scopiformis]KUJ13703.1 GroES-like protein [Mollisia scopiformis]